MAAEECDSKLSYTHLCVLLILDKTSEHIRYWFRWKEVVYQPAYGKREKRVISNTKEGRGLQYHQTHLRTGLLLDPPALYIKLKAPKGNHTTTM